MPNKKKALENKDKTTKKPIKSNVKETSTKKTTPVKKTTSTKKAASAKKTAVKKTTTVKKSTTKKATTGTKKVTKKATPKKPVKTKATKKVSKKKEILEYYDLPYTYNKTFVKILAQTPNTLFVYWEVSNEDNKSFIKKYGNNFFESTIPVLIVHNKTKNYSFEIEINDFANSWYFNVNDTKCEYEIEYGRKSKPESSPLPNNYIQIAYSNEIESPNDHILFENEQKLVFFKNTKTNALYSKDMAKLHFIKHLGNLHRIYDFYNKIYKTEDLTNIENPSSSFSCF